MTRDIRIIVADDHPLFRTALTRTVMDHVVIPSAKISVLEAESVDEVYRLLEEDEECDLVLLDVHFPGTNGLSGLANLRGCFPFVPVAMISGSDSTESVAMAADLGACGFLSKSEPPEKIAEAVCDLLEGKQWFIDHNVAPHDVVDREVGEVAEKVASLTPHQFRVFTLVCEGLLNKQIAYELNVSENTIKSHLANIFRKFNVRKRTNLIVLGNMLNVEEGSD